MHDPASDSGGFLYITEVTTSTAELESDDFTSSTAEALRQFLSHPDLRDKWTLAVYIAAPARWRTRGGHPPGSAAHKSWLARGTEKDMRSFFRVGFVQPPKLGDRIYITKRAFCGAALKLTHEQALAVPLQPLERGEASPAEVQRSMQDFCTVMGIPYPPPGAASDPLLGAIMGRASWD